MKEEQTKTLAQVKVLQALNLPKEQIEATLISVLQTHYNNDDEKIISFLEYMKTVHETVVKFH